jgi:hypothetical protein
MFSGMLVVFGCLAMMINSKAWLPIITASSHIDEQTVGSRFSS